MTILTEQQIELFSQFHTAIQDQVSEKRKQKMSGWTNKFLTPKHRIIISGTVNKKGNLTGYQLLRNWEPVISGLSWKQLKLSIKILKLL